MDYQQKRQKLLEERNEKIRDLHSKGVKASEIAKIIGIHRTHVYNIIRPVEKSAIE